ncbi:metallophosphoesterase family protein [Gammaproteobacteria bacterium]|nr:metallophosphoesterase family protein [Gammaproteobacteria bacterium]
MKAVVVSDLHIGLPFFRKAAFMQFVESLDDRTTVILNGDIVDNPHQRLESQDQAVLDFLVVQSFHRQIIWIYGNHDEGFQMADSGDIEFRRSLALGTRLMVVHGDDFDTVMPNNRWFLRLFKFCHLVRLRMGANPVHVAELAKRWAPLLYRVLTEQVKKNAVDCARESGFEAITCGHTHYVEDSVYKGVRYINTGTWTEEPLHYVSICPDTIRLANYVPHAPIDVDTTIPVTLNHDEFDREAM